MYFFADVTLYLPQQNLSILTSDFVQISFQDALDVMISCFRIGLSSTTILLKKANVNVCIKEEKLENINKNKNYRIHYNDIG